MPGPTKRYGPLMHFQAWPEDSDYLKQLAQESRTTVGAIVRELLHQTLGSMREAQHAISDPARV